MMGIAADLPILRTGRAAAFIVLSSAGCSHRIGAETWWILQVRSGS